MGSDFAGGAWGETLKRRDTGIVERRSLVMNRQLFDL
jgi:hypothetical protein